MTIGKKTPTTIRYDAIDDYTDDLNRLTKQYNTVRTPQGKAAISKLAELLINWKAVLEQ
jgi:hypothetical protein